MISDRFPVAVFPLPRMVAFPGHTLQFHIFEPRYRRMVRECIESGTMLGVAQGFSLRKAKSQPHQTVEEFLNSNQENYHPAKIFGAGPVSIVKQFPDGRFIIEVQILQRVELQEIVQHVPYLRVDAEARADLPLEPEQAMVLIGQLLETSHQILGRRAALFNELSGIDGRHTRCLGELVHSILKWFVIEAHESQRILDTDDPAERAEILLSWMKYFRSKLEGAETEADVEVDSAETAQVIPVDFHHKGSEDHNKKSSV